MAKNIIGKKGKREDKIFNNKYNNGEIDDHNWNESMTPSNIEDNTTINTLDLMNFEDKQLEFLKFFNESPFKNKGRIEMNKTWVLEELFLYFYNLYVENNLFEKNKKSFKTLFLLMAETLDLNYALFFSVLPDKVQFDIKDELHVIDKTKRTLI